MLFRQRTFIRLRNCVLFSIRYFWRTLGVSALQVCYWVIIALFLPWSSLLLSITGIWLPVFLACFFLYNNLNEAFQIEESLRAVYPEQAPLPEEE